MPRERPPDGSDDATKEGDGESTRQGSARFEPPPRAGPPFDPGAKRTVSGSARTPRPAFARKSVIHPGRQSWSLRNGLPTRAGVRPREGKTQDSQPGPGRAGSDRFDRRPTPTEQEAGRGRIPWTARPEGSRREQQPPTRSRGGVPTGVKPAGRKRQPSGSSAGRCRRHSRCEEGEGQK